MEISRKLNPEKYIHFKAIPEQDEWLSFRANWEKSKATSIYSFSTFLATETNRLMSNLGK